MRTCEDGPVWRTICHKRHATVDCDVTANDDALIRSDPQCRVKEDDVSFLGAVYDPLNAIVLKDATRNAPRSTVFDADLIFIRKRTATPYAPPLTTLSSVRKKHDSERVRQAMQTEAKYVLCAPGSVVFVEEYEIP